MAKKKKKGQNNTPRQGNPTPSQGAPLGVTPIFSSLSASASRTGFDRSFGSYLSSNLGTQSYDRGTESQLTELQRQYFEVQQKIGEQKKEVDKLKNILKNLEKTAASVQELHEKLENLKSEADTNKIRVVEALGVFFALLTVISGQINIATLLKDNLTLALAWMLFLAGILIGFIALLHYVLVTAKNRIVTAVMITVISVALIGSGVALIIKGTEKQLQGKTGDSEKVITPPAADPQIDQVIPNSDKDGG